MLYIKIGDDKFRAEFQTFATQAGKEGIRVISNSAPIAENGFLIVDGEDNIVSKRTSFTNLYRETEEYKEYTEEAEIPLAVECFEMGDVPVSPIERQISALNSRVSAITPYEQSKEAYYGEIEKVFYGVPNGNVSVFFDNYDGTYDIVRVKDRVTITFPERLADMTNINISVQ